MRNHLEDKIEQKDEIVNSLKNLDEVASPLLADIQSRYIVKSKKMRLNYIEQNKQKIKSINNSR